jgi:hypothetical protein
MQKKMEIHTDYRNNLQWFDLTKIGDITTALRKVAQESGVTEKRVFNAWKKMLKAQSGRKTENAQCAF